MSVHFSANTNKPRVLRASDLASVLRVEPSQIRAVPHIGLWHGNETLVILFTGYGQKGWDIPSDWLSITFRTPRGKKRKNLNLSLGIFFFSEVGVIRMRRARRAFATRWKRRVPPRDPTVRLQSFTITIVWTSISLSMPMPFRKTTKTRGAIFIHQVRDTVLCAGTRFNNKH